MTDIVDHHSKVLRRRQQAVLIFIWSCGLVIAGALDMPFYREIVPHTHGWMSSDLAGLARCGGYLPTWLVVAAALLLHDRHEVGRFNFDAWKRGATLLAVVCAAGVLAELAKLCFRRERADLSNAWYVFRPFAERPLVSAGLCMPSSHAVIVFSAAFILSRIFRGARPALLTLAALTGISRIIGGAHFVSDVYVGATIAWLSAHFVGNLIFGPRDERLLLPRRETQASDSHPSSLRLD